MFDESTLGAADITFLAGSLAVTGKSVQPPARDRCPRRHSNTSATSVSDN
jgi:hypothetical protein